MRTCNACCRHYIRATPSQGTRWYDGPRTTPSTLQMPFYNAVRATPYVKKALGAYYLSDATPIPAAVYRSWRNCKFIEEEGDVVFLKSPSADSTAKQQTRWD